MIQATAGQIGPTLGVHLPVVAEIADGAVVREPTNGNSKMRIFVQQAVEIRFADDEQAAVGLGANGSIPDTAAQQRHLPHCLPLAKLSQDTRRLALGDNLDDTLGHDIEGIAWIPSTEQHLAFHQAALGDALDQRLKFLRRQMAQQLAFRQQFDLRTGRLALSIKGIFVKAGRVADGSALLF